jgi:hypothetical protein
LAKHAKPDHAKRRTSSNPPTVEEALAAASGLTDDPRQLVELASDLMGLPRQEVEPVVARFLKARERRMPSGTRRAVVVERKGASLRGMHPAAGWRRCGAA